jgi:two-component sensor histidine kinase
MSVRYEENRDLGRSPRGLERLSEMSGKRDFMWRVARILRLRWRQPTLIRWLEAAALFGIALTIRFSLGPLHGAIPFLSFYPAILVAAVLLGWKEAIFVLVLSLSAGWYFFLPPGMLLLPAGWAFVGALNIAIVIALKALAQQLAEANERQRLLFQELQHRVANTLQATVGRLESVRRTIGSRPGDAANMLEEVIGRMSASAEMHRRLHDPAIFNNGLESMLREVVAAVIDQASVTVNLNVEELDLSLDQKSVIAMLVMEVANNSAKHVFQWNLGSRFEIALQALPGHRAILKVRDDGPGATDAGDGPPSKQKLGMRILQGLADQIHGTLITELDQGRKVMVDFPTLRHRYSRPLR